MATQNLTRAKGRHKTKIVQAFDAVLNSLDELSVSADIMQLAVLPDNTLIKSMSIIIVTPDDAGTSAVLDVGIDGGNELADAFDMQGAAGAVTTDEAVWLPNGGVLTVIPVYVGAASTQGKLILHVEYTVIGQTNGNFTELINS